ncbi:GIY-YIG nuclease family protein [Bacillus massiliigorillae]|uniref:GIY-YIG nuclease family protein n=1 Tax=Bacillus massiliigorillae TaxID=1243664 RepID=UPI00039D5163|nr:GIY-YIG nuclease family protein [Bacillus massiliigorillae]
MEWNVDPNHILYAVFLTLNEDINIAIGAKGFQQFTKGDYIYIGSAKKNILRRVERHYKLDKPLRWHLDYLRPYCTITKIQSYDHPEGECSLAATFAKQGEVWIKHFGASDCKCNGHLIRVQDK